VSTLLFVVLLVALYSALGRATLPHGQRSPWTAMTLRGIAQAVVAGFHELNRLHEQRWGDSTRHSDHPSRSDADP
jgi:hypothetical protein